MAVLALGDILMVVLYYYIIADVALNCVNMKFTVLPVLHLRESRALNKHPAVGEVCFVP